jgi:hypothetical protein
MEKPNIHNKKYWKDGGTSTFLYEKYMADSDAYINKLEKQLSICDVVASLPTYKEIKIECKKQLKEMNESYALGTMRSYEKRFFTSGFIRCYLFMKGRR